MSIYCSIDDDKALVSWQWETGEYQRYESKKTPVIIEITSNGTASAGLGTWTFNTYDDVTPPGPLGTYRGTSTESPYTFNVRTIRTSGTDRVIYEDSSFFAGGIRYSTVFFTADEPLKFKISIFDANNTLLFSQEKQASLAPKYNVACGNGCPEGSHKCTHNKYPGYCCIPCKETGDRLKNIANKVGR